MVDGWIAKLAISDHSQPPRAHLRYVELGIFGEVAARAKRKESENGDVGFVGLCVDSVLQIVYMWLINEMLGP